MLIMGVDPGSNTSPTVAALIDDTKIISIKSILVPKDIIKGGLRFRIKHICNELSWMFTFSDSSPSFVGIETSQYLGKANVSLNRLIGTITYIIPSNIHVLEVNPMTLKKAITGSGKADKIEVAQALIDKWFTDKKSQNILKEIIKNEEFDKSDAIAVAVQTRECLNESGSR